MNASRGDRLLPSLMGIGSIALGIVGVKQPHGRATPEVGYGMRTNHSDFAITSLSISPRPTSAAVDTENFAGTRVFLPTAGSAFRSRSRSEQRGEVRER
jgi:hypothetical protein